MWRGGGGGDLSAPIATNRANRVLLALKSPRRGELSWAQSSKEKQTLMILVRNWVLLMFDICVLNDLDLVGILGRTVCVFDFNFWSLLALEFSKLPTLVFLGHVCPS